MNDHSISDKLLNQARKALDELNQGKAVRMECMKPKMTTVIFPDTDILSEGGKRLLGIDIMEEE